jgi:hypothetical protein
LIVATKKRRVKLFSVLAIPVTESLRANQSIAILEEPAVAM